MPKEYTECVKYYKGEGMSEKAAKARCAAMFYKRHGMTVNEWVEEHGHGEAISYDQKMADAILNGGEPLDYPEEIEVEEVSLPTNKSGGGMSDEVKARMVSTTINEVDDEDDVFELIATKVGAKAYTADGRALVWSKDGIRSAAETWTGKGISINHKTEPEYGKILYSWMDEAYAVHQIIKPCERLLPWIRDNKDKMEVSIEATLEGVDMENMLIQSAEGSGLTMIFPPDSAACSPEDGCGIMASSEEENTEVEGEEPSAGEEPVESEEINANDTESETMTEDIEAIKAENEELRSENEDIRERLAELKEYKEDVLNEKRESILDDLAAYNLEASEYEDEDIDTLEKILATAKEMKSKWEEEEIVDSGAEVEASVDTSPEEKTEEEVEAEEVLAHLRDNYPGFGKKEGD